MLYLEMSKDDTHGGGTWSFPNCVWTPTRTKANSNWPFWRKVSEIQKDDTIIHLRGSRPNAAFIGYSIASSDGYETNLRPPEPKQWSFANNFFRADLTSYTPFHHPINLDAVFLSKQTELRNYLTHNKKQAPKKNLFYVLQSGKLQCLNGAYLSDVDEDLLSILFNNSDAVAKKSPESIISVETATQLAQIKRRLGHAKFAKKIKSLYKNKCCFPQCNIADPRFLIASHIARWSDNESLRGHLGNGLAFCVMHDKAFELGLFTLDREYRVYLNSSELENNSSIIDFLRPHHGSKIFQSSVLPLIESLKEHWVRTKISPQLS